MALRTKVMGWTTREPCKSCPYRMDVPVRTWHPEEFENLLAQDADPEAGSIFGCHATVKTGPQVCAGWLLDQKRRRLPSIPLRIALLRKPEARAALDGVTNGGHRLYRSIRAMCAANGVRSRPEAKKG